MQGDNETWHRIIASYEYNSRNGKLNTIHYGNGFSVRYVYDKLENVSEVWYNRDGSKTKAYTYAYTAYGQLYRYDNLLTGKSIIYQYNTAGKMTNFVEYDTDDMVNAFSSSIYYDGEGRFESLFYTMDYAFGSGTADHCIYYGYSYLPDSSLRSYLVDTDVTNGKIHYNYDTYQRVTSKVYDFYVKGASTTRRFTNTVSYTFSTNGKHGSAQVESYTSGVNTDAAVTSTYTYDGNGNITKVTLSNGQEYRYVYDDLGQLLREDNSVKSRTYVYSYDHAGNILSKKAYALTAEGETPSTLYSTNTYGYNDADWGDLLTSFNGHTITYDAIGNPLNYYNGSSFSFTWKNGRQLATAAKGTYVLSYDYNDEGIRTSKTVNGVEHTYSLSGSQIVAEEWGCNLCVYMYDADGSPIGMQYRTTSMAEGVFYTFWFEKNLQGDIVAVYNESGVKVCTYTYDVWGNVTMNWVNSIGTNLYAQYNPFRYRGYYYDSETGFYYVSSRYYDPEIGRWINADGYVSTGQGILGTNMFAYCGNNPVNRKDPTGQFWITAIIVTVVVAVCTVTLSGCSSQATSGRPRGDLAKAPDLDVSTASPDSYNCYGNGIGKQINTNPSGYNRGDSTRKTFESVKKDLGSNNVRELTSISDPIDDDEFKVALKCGPMDYHFIRLNGDKWYNKSGTAPGLYIDQSVVAGDVWYAMWMNNGQVYVGDPRYGYPYYNDETIYFAVKVGWDVR